MAYIKFLVLALVSIILREICVDILNTSSMYISIFFVAKLGKGGATLTPIEVCRYLSLVTYIWSWIDKHVGYWV